MPLNQLNKTRGAYQALYQRLSAADLFKDGPRRKLDLETAKPRTVSQVIRKAAGKLPGLYHDSYVWPLLNNLDWVIQRSKDKLKIPGETERIPMVTADTIATLVGAVTNHTDGTESERQRLRGLLAIISRVYGSFLEPEPGTQKTVPSPTRPIPPLATFQTKLDPDNGHAVPFVLKASEVNRLCGGQVGVVSIPWNYQGHPALCWPALAHEAGGHDILQAYPGLLWELRQKVRRSFYTGDDPREDKPKSKEETLGLLWQYWAEEAACDVCAILNVGPAYAKCLTVYFAALNDRFRRYREAFSSPFGTDPGPNESPKLHVSWPPSSLETTIRTEMKKHTLRPHPTDICKFHVMIGAINALKRLGEKDQRNYTDEILECLQMALSTDPPDQETIRISGWIPFKTGRWVLLDEDDFSFNRKDMEEHAQQVGRLIATTELEALNGNSLQDLETWDQSDESSAQRVSDFFVSNTDGAEEEKALVDAIDWAGDDANLLAGAIISLYKDPDQYEKVNDRLVRTLQESFAGDEYWGASQWHPIESLPKLTRQTLTTSNPKKH